MVRALRRLARFSRDLPSLHIATRSVTRYTARIHSAASPLVRPRVAPPYIGGMADSEMLRAIPGFRSGTRWKQVVAVLGCVLPMVLGAGTTMTPMARADVGGVQGLAFGAQVITLGASLTDPVPIVTLPPDGGSNSDSRTSLTLPQVTIGEVRVATSGTVSGTGRVTSSVSLGNVTVSLSATATDPSVPALFRASSIVTTCDASGQNSQSVTADVRFVNAETWTGSQYFKIPDHPSADSEVSTSYADINLSKGTPYPYPTGGGAVVKTAVEIRTKATAESPQQRDIVFGRVMCGVSTLPIPTPTPTRTPTSSPSGLTLSLGGNGPVVSGQLGIYAVRIAAASPVSGPVMATFTLPPTLSFVSGSGTNFTCTAQGQVVTCVSPDGVNPVVGVWVTVGAGSTSDLGPPVSVTVTAPGVPPATLTWPQQIPNPTPVVPELPPLALFGSGLLVLGGLGARRRASR